jgi:phenylalanyl-tRNA synthetase beta chain
MLVSLDWLREYVKVDVPVDKLAEQFALSGLNHESTSSVGSDTVIDLEVTSNRGDALGHIGIAREAAVLLGNKLNIPEIKLPTKENSYEPASNHLSVENRMPEGCDRYTARLIRGIKIGPSPKWLVDRLTAINIASVNNIVDITNYVMMECGQPLHAFEYKHIRDQKVIVRPGQKGEKFKAIDHREYELNENTIVIADAQRAIAIAGVMGGEDSEITSTTTDVVIESASFSPLAVRQTARRLRLHSPSSYRFERRVDPMGVDWASRRCCQLILELAGGTLDSNPLESNPVKFEPQVVELRKSQVDRVLGIEVPWEKCIAILKSLGCQTDGSSADATCRFTIPSHRGDLPREIDLIEEIARIWGYDKLNDATIVPTVRSAKRDKDVLLDRVRAVMVGGGFCEVLTPSCVRDNLSQLINVWSSDEPLKTITPMLEGAAILRRSIVPSLLQARALNQSAHSLEASLFETAAIYFTDAKGTVREQQTIGFVTGHDFHAAKGVIEEMVARVNATITLQYESNDNEAFDAGTGLSMMIDQQCIGWMGLLAASVKSKLKLLGTIAVAELDLDALLSKIQILPTLRPISAQPLVQRDLNFILPEAMQWKELTHIIESIRDPLLQKIDYKETYRDAKRDGDGKKRVLIGLSLQDENQTLTTERADAVIAKIVQAVEFNSDGRLLGVGA